MYPKKYGADETAASCRKSDSIFALAGGWAVGSSGGGWGAAAREGADLEDVVSFPLS
jgi:hypothetical protein